MHIKEVLLVTNDLTNARSFYNDKLGFPVTGITQTQISFRIGRSVLTFRELKNSNAQYHLAFSIPNNQLQEALTWIRKGPLYYRMLKIRL
jgi:catechol-2,3-dioxygenase